MSTNSQGKRFIKNVNSEFRISSIRRINKIKELQTYSFEVIKKSCKIHIVYSEEAYTRMLRETKHKSILTGALLTLFLLLFYFQRKNF